MNLKYRPLILALGVIGASGVFSTWNGCSDMVVKTVPGFSPEVAEIIIKKCTPCHAGGRSENGLGYIDKPAMLIAKGYLQPGDFANSLLYKKVSETPPYGGRMPKGGPYLNDAQLAILANWIDNIDDPTAEKFVVTISGSAGITTDPASTASVSKNKTLEITATAEAGAEISKTVGGSCAQGTWKDNVYKTGKITEACSVVFAKDNEAVVTASGTGVTLSPVRPVTLNKGETTYFDVTVRADDSMTYDLTSITGTCLKGSWDQNVTPKRYTTGVISANCEVIFSTANPCPTVLTTGIAFTDVQAIMAGAVDKCTSCHYTGSGDGIADFAANDSDPVAYSNLFNQNGVTAKNTNFKLVAASKPLESAVYLNMTSNLYRNGQMPQGGTPLTTPQQSQVCNWILGGAPNN